nr:Cytochrome P450 domain containing protein [Haemonchus contortus]
MCVIAHVYASSYGSEYDHHLKIVSDFTRKVISERMAERGEGKAIGREKKAFLDLLLDVQAEGNLSYEDIREEVDTFMFEGHDTTASGMGWTLWCVACNSDIQKKIHEEMDEIFGSSDRSCTSDDLKSMKYLEKCIKESLRLRPPVPNFTRKLENDVDIDGLTIPKGCSIMITPAMIHGNPKVYDNPHVYDPERFSEENIQKRHPYAYIPFSAGPRNCIGQKFALIEEKTVLSWFFRRYSIRSRLPTEANIPLPEIILKPSLGFPVTLSKR